MNENNVTKIEPAQNSIIEISPFGKFELRRFDFDDEIYLYNCLNDENMTDIDFLINILCKQIQNPKLDHSQLYKMPRDVLLKLASKLMQLYENSFRFYNNTGDFISDFRNSLKNYKNNCIDKMKKIIKEESERSQKLFQSYQAAWMEKLEAISLENSNLFKKIDEDMKNRIGNSISKISEHYKVLFQSFHVNLTNFWKSINLIGNIWKKYFDANPEAILRLVEYSKYLKEYMVWIEENSVIFLKKYKLLLPPSIPGDLVRAVYIIDKYEANKAKKLNELFYNYFSDNNWQNLEFMVAEWKKNPLFKKRIKIIRDCVEAIKNSKPKSNICNVVLPTLIVQLEGILRDHTKSTFEKFYSELGKKLNKQNLGDLNEVFIEPLRNLLVTYTSLTSNIE